MNVEIKIFIYTDTKKMHCISNIDDSAIKWNKEIISVSAEPHRETYLLGLVVMLLAWNQSDARVKSLCSEVWIVTGFNPRW